MVIFLFLAAAVGVLYLYNPTLGQFVGIALGLYLLHCTWKPRADCPSCGGSGRWFQTEAGASFMACPQCHGRGRRVRWGALIWPWNRGLYPRPPRGR